jgi:hypothetical protein
MVHRSCCLLCGLIVSAIGATIACAAPDPGTLSTAYGRGLAAYFSGNCASAEPLLLVAMSEDAKDPRPYYFRGLCLLRQGRGVEARTDFIIAAALEAHSRGGYAVGKALERVQGDERLVLEQYRWQTRTDTIAATDSKPDLVERRAALAMHTDVGALRQRVSVPLDRLVEPVTLAQLVDVAEVEPQNTVTDIAAPIGNPFTDDPRSVLEGKIRSGKLLGIVGRALMQSAPVPSLDAIRQQVPGLLRPAANDSVPPTNAEFGSDGDLAPAAENSFSEPAPSAAEPGDSEPPADAVDEDPFG